MTPELNEALVDNDEDEILFDEIRQNPMAFTVLYRRYLSRIYRYLYFKTGNPDDAEELTSQVFLAALEAIPHYDHRGQFSTWLFSIARRKVADFYRTRYMQFPFKVSKTSSSSNPEDDPLTLVIVQEDQKELQEILSTLKDDEQELLRLRFAARLQFSEIAALLKRNPSSVKMAYYRLLARLASKMEA
jgi:RNA polymerase sigma-70 factor (ECF subfamily)